MWYREVIGGGALPGGRHVVADRDGRDHDQPAARGDHHQAGLGDVPVAGRSRPRWSTSRATSVDVGGGYLTLTRPWPAMLRGIWGDPERYHETYWSRYPGRYFAGDGAKLDDDGYLWLLGRVDDVMNVSGHRISTTEVESALVSHPAVAEAAVVGATTRRPARRSSPTSRCGAARRRRSRSCATTSAARSGRSPSPRRSTSRPSCPRPAAARSCGACCATSPRAATSATRRRSPTLGVVDGDPAQGDGVAVGGGTRTADRPSVEPAFDATDPPVLGADDLAASSDDELGSPVDRRPSARSCLGDAACVEHDVSAVAAIGAAASRPSRRRRRRSSRRLSRVDGHVSRNRRSSIWGKVWKLRGCAPAWDVRTHPSDPMRVPGCRSTVRTSSGSMQKTSIEADGVVGDTSASRRRIEAEGGTRSTSSPPASRRPAGRRLGVQISVRANRSPPAPISSSRRWRWPVGRRTGAGGVAGAPSGRGRRIDGGEVVAQRPGRTRSRRRDGRGTRARPRRRRRTRPAARRHAGGMPRRSRPSMPGFAPRHQQVRHRLAGDRSSRPDGRRGAVLPVAGVGDASPGPVASPRGIGREVARPVHAGQGQRVGDGSVSRGSSRTARGMPEIGALEQRASSPAGRRASWR